VEYLRDTGRSPQEVQTFEAYFRAQGLFGIPLAGQVDYSKVLRLDLAEVTPSLAGPGRPQDRIELGQVAQQFEALFAKPVTEGGFGHSAAVMATRRPLRHTDEGSSGKTPMRPPMAAGAGRSEAQIDGITVGHGDVLIAAITSCTNTSNPGVMLAAGLLAQKAVDRGLRVPAHIKTSLAPGSRMVTDYLSRAGLLPALQTLGFALVGYGCTTCIGNSGDLTPELNEAIAESDLVCAAVLSGNRNFEARIHPSIKANFLASPPLVVAYALAGSVLKDLQSEPLGTGRDGQDVFLRDIWPSSQEVHALMGLALDGERYRASYARVQEEPGPLWTAVQGSTGQSYDWPGSTYSAEPPFFASFTQSPPAAGGEVAVRGARVMALFGDSITTDHISPAGSIKASSPAGQWLLAHGVGQADFNSYGSRRGHHEVMMRGTFANVRIKNLMLAPAPDGARVEGGITVYQQPGPHQGEVLSIFDAAMRYAQEQVPTVIFAGEEYGTGSSRDWAAKGTRLLGVRAVVARSFERIHRSNLVGMGVLPLQFLEGQSWQMLRLQGDERIDIELDPRWTPLSRATLRVTRTDGTSEEVTVILRIDTPIEVDYYQHGGILPFVLRQLLA
jgi:aconitate hydratase